jgi:hypothetical protein
MDFLALSGPDPPLSSRKRHLTSYPAEFCACCTGDDQQARFMLIRYGRDLSACVDYCAATGARWRLLTLKTQCLVGLVSACNTTAPWPRRGRAMAAALVCILQISTSAIARPINFLYAVNAVTDADTILIGRVVAAQWPPTHAPEPIVTVHVRHGIGVKHGDFAIFF